VVKPASWATIGTATASAAGTFDFDDTLAGSFALRFYRLAIE